MAGDRISYEVDFSAKGAQTLWNEFLAGSESAGRALNQALGGRVKKELFVETVVDDSGVKRLVAGEREVLTELQKIINLQQKANQTQYGSVTSLRQQVNEAKKVRDGMVKYASSVDGISGKLNTINAAWTAQNQRVRDLQRQLDIAGASNVWQKLAAEYNLGGLASAGRQITELVNVFQSVSIIVGQVIGSVNQLFDVLQKVQSIKLTFQGIGAGADVGAVFSESSRIALGLGVNLNTVRDAFQQLSPVILATGGNIGNVSAITESLSSRFVTFGLSADKSRRVMNGVVQAFSKGKLMAEELTQQISEADPAFRTDLASAIGVSVKELGEMVKAGEVTNAVLLEAIPRMSKSAGLFGKLGASALDAAKGFRDGSVTVEQFRAQLGNIEQLALEDLINPDTGALQPLLASLNDLRAVVTDVVVAFARSEVFETFLDLLGQVASVVSIVVQAIVKIGTVITSITQPVFGAINAIDSLGGLLKGFGIISTAIAAVIVTKLIASLVALGSGAIVGAATAAINGLTAAVTLFNAGGLAGLANNIATAIVQLLGLGTATTTAAAAQGAATASTSARITASGLLTKALGIQTAAEALATAAAGSAAAAQVKTAGGIVITGAAAAGATPPVVGLATATAGLATAFLAAAPLLLTLTAGIGILAGAFAFNKAVTEDANTITKDFSSSLRGIQASAKLAKEGLKDGEKGADEFTKKLEALKTASIFEVGQKSGIQRFAAEVNLDKVIDSVKRVGVETAGSLATARKAIAEYDAATDKSGNKGKAVAQDVIAAESAIASAIEITKKKRDKILEEEAKGGKPSPGTIRKLGELDAEIGKLEEQRVKIAEVRAEARAKGVKFPVELDIQDAETILAGFGEKAKGLKAQVTLETNPEKRAELQGELNALKANLEFLEGDQTEITIEAKFKIDTRALKDADALAKATLDNLKAVADNIQASYKLETAGSTNQEADIREQLNIVKERLEIEKEIRKNNIQSAKDAGRSEAFVKQLQAADRAAEQAGKEEIRAIEGDLKDIANDKKEIERKAIQAKINALPAQQAAERASLQVQQELARLELERLANASKRAAIEGKGLLIKLGGEISKAVKDKDTEEEKRLRDQYNLQLKYLGLLDAEQVSLGKSLTNLDSINQLQKDTLNQQQQATATGLQAELAALGTATATQATATAAGQTAAAGSNAVSNAQTLARLAREAAQYARTGAVAARTEADARGGARKALEGQVTAAASAVDTSVGKAEDSAGNAATNAGEFSSNLEGAAGWAQSVASTLTGLDGTDVNFSVNYTGVPGLWTGGPTTGGQTYRINELGKEGFLSSTGDLSPINKPRNALWKAPGRGMVIPAHIMSSLDIPTGRVSTGVRPATATGSGNSMSRIVRAIQNALIQTSRPDPGLHEMASVQAHQAQQIGKLSRAVTKLADKDWNVNVGVRNTGSTAYLDALNRRM